MTVAIAPTPLEIASSMMVGEHLGAPPLPDPAEQTPRRALELAVLEALRRPPCLVSFSGGRDSSALLAVAALVARREDLPLPVPATIRFPAAAEETERRYQDKVVRLLGIEDWHLVQAGPELELLGTEAAAVLRRHGLLFPRYRHVHASLVRAARGGSFMTGFDGNELFGSWRYARAWDVLAGRAGPRPRDAGRVALALAPRSLRRARLAAAFRPGRRYWLRPHAEQMALAKWLEQEADQPPHWSRRIDWYARRRRVNAVAATLRRLGADEDAEVVLPLVDPRFLAALGRAGGRSGLGSRDAMMGRLFGDLLPDDVLTRSFRPAYGPTLWGERTRAFAASWNGEGVDPELVDPDALRRAWAACDGDAVLLLQAAWLAPDSGQTAAGRLTEAGLPSRSAGPR